MSAACSAFRGRVAPKVTTILLLTKWPLGYKRLLIGQDGLGELEKLRRRVQLMREALVHPDLEDVQSQRKREFMSKMGLR